MYNNPLKALSRCDTPTKKLLQYSCIFMTKIPVFLTSFAWGGEKFLIFFGHCDLSGNNKCYHNMELN
jgi:hypothetical protein